MKRLFVLMSCAVLLSACASRTQMPAWKPVARTAAPKQIDAQGNSVPRLRAGVSSATVEKLASAEGCTGGQGASLISEPGPVETYRMVCESGQSFVAKCEFRQCKAVALAPAGGYAMQAPAPVALPAPQVASVVATSPVASPAAMPVAAAAPARAAAMPAPTGREVPRLVVTWDCGACAKNEQIAAVLIAAYAKEAAARGYSVSNTEVGTMAIRKYREKSTESGVAPGRDFINTSTVANGKTVKITDASSSMSFNMTSLAEKVGRETFDKLYPAGK
jgi:hypothetical protein